MLRLTAVAIAISAMLGCGSRTGLRGEPSRRVDSAVRDSGIADSARPDVGDEVDAAVCGGDCSDGVFCNGLEYCSGTTRTCVSREPVGCDDGDECTIDSCAEALDSCRYVPTPRDADGDGVGACEGDCDDDDPRRSPRLEEVCDEIDNNCDGRVDEGVLSACGDCRPGCNRVVVPGATGWMPDGESSAGVEVDPDGDLVLSSTRTETFFAWIANHLFGTITRLDTRTGMQAAEYDSVLLDGTNDGRPPGERCRTDRAGGNCPSRTAVDLRGAVYVANRAFFNQGTVTKIAGFESDCVDRNGNGVIDTSRDLDADGVIERSVPGEFLGQEDECLLWTVNVGERDGVPRAVAIDAGGMVWVGLHNAGQMLQLDPNDGSVIQTVTLPTLAPFGPFRPYGAAADGAGNVWAVEAASGSIIRVEAATGAVGSRETAVSRADGCSSSYGIAIDEDDRVWVAGFLCEYVFRYTPAADRWFEVPIPDSGASRGIAADGEGRIYVASSHEYIRIGPGGMISAGPPITRLTMFDADTGGSLQIVGTETDPLPGLASTGVGLDSAGRVWLINQDSSSATRLDLASGEAREYPTGESPYTYSDFTGFALRTFTAPNGFMRAQVEGCAIGPTEWERLDWSASVPAGSRIEVRARAANRAVDLPSATWLGPWTVRPTDLALPPGPVPALRFLELEISLFSDDTESTPTIDELVVQFNCPI